MGIRLLSHNCFCAAVPSRSTLPVSNTVVTAVNPHVVITLKSYTLARLKCAVVLWLQTERRLLYKKTTQQGKVHGRRLNVDRYV